MIVFDRNKKEIKVPEGLGNINITVLDATMEDVVVNITDIETTILPSPGYNGMSSVEVNAQSVYDNGYNEGETDQKAKLTGITITENGTYSREDGYNEITVDVPDLNGDYNEGYEAGKVDGYEQGNITGYENGFVEGNATGYANGVNDGKAEQKALLEPITITENGVYSTEDGYSEVTVNIEDTNGSYDVGYSEGYEAGIEEGTANAGEIIAETARVLNITENGHYLSKYSEPVYPTEITGVYSNGDNFYNYAKLAGVVFNTGIIPNETTKLEFWFKPNFSQQGTVVGVQFLAYPESVFKLYVDSTVLKTEIGGTPVDINIEDKWYHIQMSFADGLIVDGEKKGDYTRNLTNTRGYTLAINALNPQDLDFNSNGTYGMIKITNNGVENVFIPTAEGFLNTTTNELLAILQDGSYNYVENNIQYGEGDLIKTVNVNVMPKINVVEAGLKFGNSSFTEFPEWADFDGVTNMINMFYGCRNLKTIPQLDTSSVTDMQSMLEECDSLQTIPLIDTSSVTNMQSMFDSCNSLQTIPLIDTSNVTNMSNMFYDCGNLISIPQLDTSNVTNMGYMFSNCRNLKSLPPLNVSKVSSSMGIYFNYSFMGDINELTDVGGWIGLKINWDDDSGLARCPNLTYESCINILNGLADVTELGGRKLKVHSNFLTTVGDEISIGVQKGWTITA